MALSEIEMESQIGSLRRRLDDVETSLSAWRTQGLSDLLVPGSQAVGQTVGGVLRWLDLELDNNNIANTSDETSLYAVTIPAGQLSPPRMVMVELMGDVLNDSGTTLSVNFIVKLGATDMWEDSLTVPANLNRRGLYWKASIAADAVGSQEVGGFLSVSNAAAAVTGIGSFEFTAIDPDQGSAGFSGTATENEFTDLVLDFRVDMSVADADFRVRRRFASAVIL